MSRTDTLKEIINETLKVDVMMKCRNRDVVDARKIYANILYSKGLGVTFIGNSLSKNHATILHYVKQGRVLYLIDKVYKDNYDRVLMHYDRRTAGSSINLLTRTELEEEIERLKIENNSLKIQFLNHTKQM